MYTQQQAGPNAAHAECWSFGRRTSQETLLSSDALTGERQGNEHCIQYVQLAKGYCLSVLVVACLQIETWGHIGIRGCSARHRNGRIAGTACYLA